MTLGLAVDLFAWAVVFLLTFAPFWRVVTGKGYDHDPLFVGFFITSIVLEGFNLRWVVAPHNFTALEILRWLSAALSGFFCVLIRFYKRVG